jgi:hypothetical protein
MDEILSFGGPGKLKLADALKKAKSKKKRDVKPKSSKWSSSGLSDSDDEDYGGSRCRRKRRNSEKMSAADRFRQKAAVLEQCVQDTPPAKQQEEGCDSGEEKEVKVVSPPSPLPSPPPLVLYTDAQSKQSKTLLKADQLLMELTQPQPLSELLVEQNSGLEDSLVATPSSLPLTLRVRCRGKIHRFAVNKDDPLVLLCAELGKELGVKGEQILLSHRTVTLSTTASPASLGLSTVDIIDAIVVLEEQLVNANGGTDGATLSLGSGDTVSLKVQSSKKTATYSIAKTDALSKVMTAFAAVLEVPVSRIKFTFDGDPISPGHTATDLDLENDDIIDARLII